MSKRVIYITAFVLSFMMAFTCGCDRKSKIEETTKATSNDSITTVVESSESVEIEETTKVLSDENALMAIKNYCISLNPDLEDLINAEEYPIYWEIDSSDENEIVVLYRSYTGALCRYYIARTTGDTYVTEFVPGITEEEEKTGENFNIKDYLSEN